MKQTKRDEKREREKTTTEFPVYWNKALSSRTAKFDFIKFYFIIQ